MAAPQGQLLTPIRTLLLLIVVSLPLEGVLADLTGSGYRTPTFYLMTASFIPIWLSCGSLCLHNLSRARSVLWISGIFSYTVLLWVANPLNDSYNEILLTVQLLVMAITISPLAQSAHRRRQATIAFMAGWAALMIFSLIRAGHYERVVYQDSLERYDLVAGLWVNKLGGFTACGLAMAVVLWIEAKSGWKRILLAACMFVAVWGLMICNSRGAIVALVVTVLYVVLKISKEGAWQKKYRRLWSIGAVVALLAASVFLLYRSASGKALVQWVLMRANSVSVEQGSGRLDLAMAGGQILVQHPFGVGVENSMYYIGTAVGKDWCFDVHNEYLRVFLEAGVVGGLLFLYALFRILRAAWRNGAGMYDRALYAGLLFNLINAFGSHNFYYKTTWFFIAMCAFMPVKEGRPEVGDGRQDRGPVRSVAGIRRRRIPKPVELPRRA